MALELLTTGAIASGPNYAIVHVVANAAAPTAADAGFDLNQASFDAAYGPAGVVPSNFNWMAGETAYCIFMGATDTRVVAGAPADKPTLIYLAGGVTVACDENLGRAALTVMAAFAIFRHSIIA